MASPLTVCWISDFGVEWLPELPEELKQAPRTHPMTWQQVLLGELANAPDLKLHVIVLRNNIRKDIVFKTAQATFHVLKTLPGSRAPSLFWTDTILIKKKLADIRPDLVHAWGTERGAGLVASRLNFPFLITVQGLLSWYGQVIPLRPLERLSAFLENLSLPRAALVTTESTFAAKFIQERHPNLNIRQIEHAPRQIFHQVERRPQTSPLRFIFVGTFEYRKGADLLLLALDQLRTELDFELIVVGEGSEMRAKLAGAVSQALWDRIQFQHQLKPDEIARELGRATMMIFPTRADTSPNAVKEAVVAGLPVVASQVGGIPDYVLPGQNGILFSPGKAEELVRAIRAACRHPLFAQGLVAPDSLSQTREYLAPRVMGQKFLTAYKELAGSKRP